VAFSPECVSLPEASAERCGQWLVSGAADSEARVWDMSAVLGAGATDVQEIARKRHQSEVTSVAFSPDGEWVASGANDGAVSVWDASTGEEVFQMTHKGAVSFVAFSPRCDTAEECGRWLASKSESEDFVQLSLWRPEDLKDMACMLLPRNLSYGDWEHYLPDEDYQATCPDLPLPEEDVDEEGTQ